MGEWKNFKKPPPPPHIHDMPNNVEGAYVGSEWECSCGQIWELVDHGRSGSHDEIPLDDYYDSSHATWETNYGSYKSKWKRPR